MNRGWVPPVWRHEWRQRYAAQQPAGAVSVAGTAQGSEDPSSFVPRNEPDRGNWYWLDVHGVVSPRQLIVLAARQPLGWAAGSRRGSGGCSAVWPCPQAPCLTVTRAHTRSPPRQAEACGLHPATPLLQVLEDGGGARGEAPGTPGTPFPLTKRTDAVVKFSTMPADHTGYAVMWGGIAGAGLMIGERLLRKGR